MAQKKAARTPEEKARSRLAADQETRWVDAWNDLFDLVGDARQMRCLLPDGTDVDVEACKGWLQDAVYAGDRVGVARGWVKGRPGVHAMREPFSKN